MNYFGYPVVNGYRSQSPAGFYDPVKGHTGVDISCPEGTALALPTVNTVVAVKQQPEMGLTLYLRDSVGNILVFSHLSSVSVNVGDEVAANSVFANTGNTGSATTGAHLHFEIICKTPEVGGEMMSRTLGEFSGYNIDPLPYLDSIFEYQWAAEAMSWAKKHQIIKGEHAASDYMTWGEFVVSAKRLAERIMDWKKNE